MNGDQFTMEDIIEALETVEAAMQIVATGAIVINDKEFSVRRRDLGRLILRLETFGALVRKVAEQFDVLYGPWASVMEDGHGA